MRSDTNEQIRKRVRTAAARFLKRHRSAIAVQHRNNEATSAKLELLREQLETQRRLQSEKEAEFSDLFLLLERRAALADQLEATAKREQELLEQRRKDLHAELAGLESRIANARAILAEQQDAKAAVAITPKPALAPAWDEVPLAISPEISKQAAQLEARENQIREEERQLALARRELQQLAEKLSDERVVVAEQLGRILAAEQQWQHEELGVVAELEMLANELAEREVTEDERDRRVWQYQSTLLRWHAAIDAGLNAMDARKQANEQANRVRELDAALGLVTLNETVN